LSLTFGANVEHFLVLMTFRLSLNSHDQFSILKVKPTLTLLANIRLGCKSFHAEGLAYLSVMSVETKKKNWHGFLVPMLNIFKIFMMFWLSLMSLHSNEHCFHPQGGANSELVHKHYTRLQKFSWTKAYLTGASK
jgi:hypothetical protein